MGKTGEEIILLAVAELANGRKSNGFATKEQKNTQKIKQIFLSKF